MGDTSAETKVIMNSIENILDYMILNCDIEKVKSEYSEDRERLHGIQISLGTSNPEDSMAIDILLEDT